MGQTIGFSYLFFIKPSTSRDSRP